MAWTAPNTAVAGTAWTAADFNTFVRDNLNATEAGVTVPGNGVYNLAVTDHNELTPVTAAALGYAAPIVSTASATYVTLGGATPSVTLTTGYVVWLSIYSWTRSSVASGGCWVGIRLSGATTGDFNVYAAGSPAAGQLRLGASSRLLSVNPGTNTFTCIYVALNGGTAEFAERTLSVIPI